MTALWLLVPLVLLAGAGLVAVVARRVSDALVELQVPLARLEQVRLATVAVEDDLAALRATLAHRTHR